MRRARRASSGRRTLCLVVAGLGLVVAPLHAQRASEASDPAGFAPFAGARVPALDAPVTLTLAAPLRVVLARIASQANLSLAFDDSLPGLDVRVTVRADGASARSALADVLAHAPLRALVSPTGQIVLRRAPLEPPPERMLAGSVHDVETGAPVAGARIELAGTRYVTYSRADGSFALGRVADGAYVLRAQRLGFEPVVIGALHVPNDVGAEGLRIDMRRAVTALSAVVVTPGYYGLLQPSLASPNALSREQLETVPQVGEDIYRAVSRLPGVSADDFSAKFNVRGASGDELYVSLDGLELVEPFHLEDVGGAFSIVDIQSLGTASLTTGGFSAEYGDRLTGVFTLVTADPRTDRARTSIGVSVMNARVTSQGGYAGGKGGWLVSVRPGYLDVALKLTSIRDSLRPRYYDLFAKTVYDLGRAGRLGVHLLRASDTFRYLEQDEPNVASDYASDYGWLTLETRLGSRVRVSSVASLSALDWRRDGDRVRDGVQTALIHDRRALDRVAVRQDWTLEASPSLMLKWGVDAKHEAASYDYFSAVRDRDQWLADSTVSDTNVVAVAPRTDRLGLYVAPRVRLLPSLTMELGVRYDRNSHLSESMVSPRLNLSWEPREGTTLRGAWGRYAQTEPLFALQAEDGVSTFSPAERAEQRVVSVEQALPFGLVARAEAYDRLTDPARPTYTNAGGDLLIFPELSWDRFLVDRTASRSRGVELQASRRDGGRTDWSLSYVLASSTDVVDGRTVPRQFDQRHTLHGDWSIRPASNAWRLSVGAVWHSGWPYTPTTLLADTLVDTPTQFSVRTSRRPGEIGSRRLRAYKRIDARWTRYIDTSHGRLSLFAEVYNLLGTKNQRGLTRELIVRGRSVQVGGDETLQWPRLPLAGFTWEF
jgi:hypothetical protein